MGTCISYQGRRFALLTLVGLDTAVLCGNEAPRTSAIAGTDCNFHTVEDSSTDWPWIVVCFINPTQINPTLLRRHFYIPSQQASQPSARLSSTPLYSYIHSLHVVLVPKTCRRQKPRAEGTIRSTGTSAVVALVSTAGRFVTFIVRFACPRYSYLRPACVLDGCARYWAHRTDSCLGKKSSSIAVADERDADARKQDVLASFRPVAFV